MPPTMPAASSIRRSRSSSSSRTGVFVDTMPMTMTEPGAKEPDRLESAVAALVVPLHQEGVVGQLAEDPLGHRLQRALAHPRRAVVPAADVQRRRHLVRDALQRRPGRPRARLPGDRSRSVPRGLEPRDPGGVRQIGVQGEVELHVRAPAAMASATSVRSISMACVHELLDGCRTPVRDPRLYVNGCAKIDAAGNVTLKGWPPVTPARKPPRARPGSPPARSRSTTSCTASGTSSPRVVAEVHDVCPSARPPRRRRTSS